MNPTGEVLRVGATNTRRCGICSRPVGSVYKIRDDVGAVHLSCDSVATVRADRAAAVPSVSSVPSVPSARRDRP
jgi:hypothetical protein